ncbi:Rad4-domain-containing protein [Microstroma glucosiphilum]|uniref:Rad4-domain-containing protein n=1 Tax=Pseudomicrostroma glucosiphilum TaxID=1684307 RepID=A0A316U2N2_9BASI|nr:Rad4-domain-containing protein [Pseudomicrostroma glucosiphilum]PWN18653.1 Rad4-domain-containing protein [Pseudomicrostroma glucosiphilum]
MARPPDERIRRASTSKASKPSASRRAAAKPREVIELATTDDEVHHGDDDEDEDMEEVELPSGDRSIEFSANGDGDDEEMEMEEVNIQHPSRGDAQPAIPDYSAIHQSEDDATASAGDQSDTQAAPALVFHDGKGGQGPLSLTFNEDRQSKSADAAKKKRTNILTPRDRAARLDGHKLHVLALLAHAKLRNRWLNDEDLRDHLYNMSPQALRQKLRSIHPKKVPEQRERVRLFESFMGELVRWWAARFYLNPDQAAAGAIRQPDPDLVSGAFPPPGKRVDGWKMESIGQRERRHQKEEKERKKASRDARQKLQSRQSNQSAPSMGNKGKARRQDTDDEDIPSSARPLPTADQTRRLLLSRKRKAIDEIALFPPGSDPSPRPALLRLLPAPEPMHSSADMLAAAEAKAGSRETSAQLFCALCRALGIPARLVISPQVAPWSVGAGKVGQTVGAVEADIKGSAAAARGQGKAATKKGKKRAPPAAVAPQSRFARRGTDDGTSDDFDFEDGLQEAQARATNGASESKSAPSSTRSRPAASKRAQNGASGSSSRPLSVASTGTASADEDQRSAVSTPSKTAPKITPGSGRKRAVVSTEAVVIEDDEEDITAANGKGGAKGKGKRAAKPKKDEDYRDEKWKNLSAPLSIDFTPKLRVSKPQPAKETALESSKFDDVSPIDLASPPTMWVEVFSKPFQRWLTVDPIRARLTPTGNRQMEPLPQDRTNKLVYVVAFEEDGYARDVTARYTKTLHSRVSRMRPPPTKSGGDWWEGVVRAMHRHQRLERDAVEDAELEEAASKEPMPNSVGGFKDHPVFTLERHLRRDEVLHPQVQVGTFQGIPVFHRKNVVTLRSARQWYSEGRKVSEGEIAMKWVKSRGYTLANKRAEEQARAEGGEEPTEGLYARHQTELYRAPPVVDGIVPKNHFGNIDLFVPSMLPEGAAHIPHNGSAKIAKKLNINYAEAIVGFEFRKHRSMPRMKGIVVPEEAEEMVLDAYWENEQLAAQREVGKQTERALRHWRKLLNALRIAKRIEEQYGAGGEVDPDEIGGAESGAKPSRGGGGGGGFIADDEEDEERPTQEQSVSRLKRLEEPPAKPTQQEPRPPSPPVERSKMAAKLDKYGSGSRAHPAATDAAPSRLRVQDTPQPEEEPDEHQSGDQAGVRSRDFAQEEAEEVDQTPVDGSELVDVGGGQILSLDELTRLEQAESMPSGKRERKSTSAGNGVAETTSPAKRRRVVIKPFAQTRTHAPAAESVAPSPQPSKRPRRAAASRGRPGRSLAREESTSEEDEADVEEVTAAGRGAPPRRRSARTAAVGRTRGSLKEPDDEEEEEEDDE